MRVSGLLPAQVRRLRESYFLAPLYERSANSARIRRVWIQREIRLEPRPRGFHLVTGEVEEAVPELRRLQVGLATLLIQHTSASLTLNENASSDVRRDFAAWFDRAVPEGADYWTHTLEGSDDMPAHIKASLTGSSLVLPISNGRFALGTWQGIYLCEHRDSGGPRTIVCTAFGEAS
jgi:secondary thiamine-phosphate synthase enzyme